MDIKPGIVSAYCHSEKIPGEIITVLKIGDAYETAVISERDLQQMIDRGVLVDVSGTSWNTAYIKVNGVTS